MEEDSSLSPRLLSSTATSLKPPRTAQTQTPPKHIRLSSSDLATVRHALGGLSAQNELPTGLYNDVVRSRKVAQYQYILTGLMFSTLLILQLLLGATLTALSSASFSSTSNHSTATTILATANTVIAGLLALMHNSGLPDRYKKDWSEFDVVEMFMREVLETGIVPVGDGEAVNEGEEADWVIEKCFEMFRDAKRTVDKNKPAAYISASGSGASKGKKNQEMV